MNRTLASEGPSVGSRAVVSAGSTTAGIVAALGAGVLIGRGHGALVLAACVGLVALTVGMVNWRWSIFGLILYLPVSGIPTLALYPATTPGVLAKDVLFVVPAYAGFITAFVAARRSPNFAGAPTVVLASFALLVLVQALNPALPNGLVGLIGVKVWLLYMPLLYVGYHLASTRADVERVVTLLALGAVLPCVIGIVEAAFVYSGRADAVYRIYGGAAVSATQQFTSLDVGNGAFLRRVPSTFSFITQYYLFTAAMVAVGYAWLHGVARSRNGRIAGRSLVVLACLASFTSGSRGSFVFIPVLLVLILLLDRAGAARLLAFAGVVVALIFVTLTILGAGAGGFATHIAEDFDSNGGFILDWMPKALHLTHWGLGTGVDTNAARYAFNDQSAQAQFSALGGTWFETWWVKALLELGVFGFVLVVVAFGGLLKRAISSHLRLLDPRLRAVSAAFVALFVWNLLYALKGQYIDFDPMNVYLWLFLGIAFGIARIDRDEQKASTAQPRTDR